MIITESIHDNMRTRSAVVYIAHDMQRVDGQALDKVAHRHNKIIRTLRRDNGTDYDIDIGMFVRFDARFVQQLLNDIRELCWKCLAYFRTGIFGRNVLAYFYQLVQCYQIPVIQVRFLLLDKLQLLFRIIN